MNSLVVCSLLTFSLAAGYSHTCRHRTKYQNCPVWGSSSESSESSGSGASLPWTYSDVCAWGNDDPICNTGLFQSPIAIKTSTATSTVFTAINFDNYGIPFATQPTVKNIGYTVIMQIPLTTNGHRPKISGGPLNDTYIAEQLHLHWGGKNSRGSEHSINKCRFDGELHIVHVNEKYATIGDALGQPGGLAVITVMFDAGKPDISSSYPGLNEFFKKLRDIRPYSTEASLQGTVTLADFLANVDRSKYFTYAGSLTTPPCSEGVQFIIFEKPERVSQSKIARFWKVRDANDNPITNNYRPIQKLNGRTVFKSW